MKTDVDKVARAAYEAFIARQPVRRKGSEDATETYVATFDLLSDMSKETWRIVARAAVETLNCGAHCDSAEHCETCHEGKMHVSARLTTLQGAVNREWRPTDRKL